MAHNGLQILKDTILLMSQNCYNNVYAVKKFVKVLTLVNNMNSLDLYHNPSKYCLLFKDFTNIIQNLPVPVKNSFLCVCSLSFELHGAFSRNNENE